MVLCKLGKLPNNLKKTEFVAFQEKQKQLKAIMFLKEYGLYWSVFKSALAVMVLDTISEWLYLNGGGSGWIGECKFADRLKLLMAESIILLQNQLLHHGPSRLSALLFSHFFHCKTSGT